MFVTNLLFFPTGGRQHKPLHPAPDGFIIMVLFCAAKGNGMARKNVKKYRRYAGILAAACLTVLPASGCRAGVQPLSRTGVALDTVVTITLYDCRDASLLDSCFAQIAHDEALFSRTREGSDVWNLNHAAGAWTPVAPETETLLRTAKALAAQTQGAFDPTIAPVSALWDFTAEDPALPDSDRLAGAASHVGYAHLEVEDGRARLTDPSGGRGPRRHRQGFYCRPACRLPAGKRRGQRPA